jgi:hypothetical protein
MERLQTIYVLECFSYEMGPCHIWEDGTEKEKEEARKWTTEQNKLLELECRREWELETGMRRLRITRNVSG